MSVVAKPVYAVPVRELIRFVLQAGDLGGKRDFVGSNRTLAGTRGHQQVQRSRPVDYQKEVPITHDFEDEDFIMRVRGRLDGLTVSGDSVRVEEIKTVQGAWTGVPDPLHWAQAKFYAGMYCRNSGFNGQVMVELTYLQLETGKETTQPEKFATSELEVFLKETADVYLQWLKEHHAWCKKRDASIANLQFPFSGYRPGQRELAVAAYRTLASGGRLFLEAPTGIGKTMSVLFPAIKTLGERKLERLFYLTARTVGRTIAEKALITLRETGLSLRSVTITAKDKVCIRNGKPCDLLTCPLALGYYDRCKPAIRAALERETINQDALAEIGQQHQICPFELSLDVSTWVDIVICDYNYVFNPQVYLRRHFVDEGGNFGFLVDEAHNLVDRAREMFSAELNTGEIVAVQKLVRKAVPRCAKALTKLAEKIRNLYEPTNESTAYKDAPDSFTEPDLFQNESALQIQPLPNDLSAPADVGLTNTPKVLRAFPEDLLPMLETALTAAEEWLIKNEPADFREDLLMLFFRLHSFRRVAQIYDERYRTIINAPPSIGLHLFCVDPSDQLQKALARGKSAVFFSATLTPVEYYRTLLGGQPEDPILQLTSPFPSENLSVLIQDRIRTSFKSRAETLEAVVETIGALVTGRRGNYLIYFPSYQYLAQALALFETHYPSVSVLTQRPGMSDAERNTFLQAFTTDHDTTLAGFAVLGGIFGEGIDLVGEHLIGAAIVGVGLPQICVERNLIRDYFEEKTGAGFDYAYTFPGMNRVLQAIGRVIRSETDVGIAVLIDSRFEELRYRRLFPAWWQYLRVRNLNNLQYAIENFWNAEK